MLNLFINSLEKIELIKKWLVVIYYNMLISLLYPLTPKCHINSIMSPLPCIEPTIPSIANNIVKTKKKPYKITINLSRRTSVIKRHPNERKDIAPV